MTSRIQSRGATLPLILVLIALLQLLATAAFDMSVSMIHQTANLRDQLVAFHAADAALVACAHALDRRSVPVHRWPGEGEPVLWRSRVAFDGPTRVAFEITPNWPGSIRPPQCLVESRSVPGRPQQQAYWLTARGFGARADTQAWSQLQIVYDEEAVSRVWRSVAERPF